MKQKLACFALGVATALIAVSAIHPPHVFAAPVLGPVYIHRIDMTGKDIGAVVSSNESLAVSCFADDGHQVCFVAGR
jgi:hypothetical protein